MKLLVAAALTVVSGAAGAATLGEEKRFEINALNDTDFEVIRLQHMGATEIWCAAASYVETQRGMSETTPIYIRQPLGPARTVQGAKGVVFTLSEGDLPSGAIKSLTVKVDQVGQVMKSAQARRFCRDAFTRSTK